jgi:UDP-N-acetylmuramate dehydrogenase
MPVDPLDLKYAAGLGVERHVPLGPYTTLKIGGPADFFVRTRSAPELARTLQAAHHAGLPWLLVGGGSNMLISDRGFRGLAIKVEMAPGPRPRVDVLEETAGAVFLRCDAGVLTARLARWTANLGWRDFEWGCGIPGTVGGAAAGNAGAYGGDMARSVERVRAWYPDGERVLEASALEYGYRTSRFKASTEPAAILSVDLRLTPGDRDAALAQIEEYERHRRERQPSERSCGSVFKNPCDAAGNLLDHAGRLIELAGLKGAAAGDMQISERHGNFFVNRGKGRAADVLALVRLARERVAAVHGIRLETEILLQGDWLAEEVADL